MGDIIGGGGGGGVGNIVGGLAENLFTRKDKSRANKQTRKAEALQRRRERIRFLRQQRVQSARVTASAASGGVSAQSSGVQQAQNFLRGQTGQELQFSQRLETMGAKRNQLLNHAEGAATNAQYLGQFVGAVAGA